METKNPGCNKCPGKPSPQPPRIFRLGSLSSPCPGCSKHFSRPHLGEPGPGTAGRAVPRAARRHAATHRSRSARATAAAAGWLRAGIREGWRALAPEVADMWLEPASP